MGLQNLSVEAVITIRRVSKVRILQPGLLGLKRSQWLRVLIKYKGHCPIIRSVIWPQQRIMAIVNGL